MASKRAQRERFELTILLPDGTDHSFRVAKMPQAWKSWLMGRLPYDTVFQGVQFHRVDLDTPRRADQAIDIEALRARYAALKVELAAGTVARADLYDRFVERADLYRTIRSQEA